MKVEIQLTRGLSGAVWQFESSEPHAANEKLVVRALVAQAGFFTRLAVHDGADATVLSLRCAGCEMLERPLPSLLFGGPRPREFSRWCPAGAAVEVELLRDAWPSRWAQRFSADA